jgi:cell division septum initiation protein DivIVA
MQNSSDDIIASLRNNLKRIINLYEGQKEENRVLQEHNKDLQQKIDTLELKKKELIEKSNNTNLAQAFIEASGSNHNAKIKVNRIVREIDKCIALLNK